MEPRKSPRKSMLRLEAAYMEYLEVQSKQGPTTTFLVSHFQPHQGTQGEHDWAIDISYISLPYSNIVVSILFSIIPNGGTIPIYPFKVNLGIRINLHLQVVESINPKP